MIRLGLRLTLRGGRGAAARLTLMACAIGIGVAFVLAAGAYTAGQQARADRKSTRDFPTGPSRGARLLWSVQTLAAPGDAAVTSIAVAPLTRDAPAPPGTRRVPDPGTVLVSPELARRLETDDARVTVPGRVVGTLGPEALASPRDLVMMAGWRADDLRSVDTGAAPISGFTRTTSVTAAGGSFWRALALTPFVLLGAIVVLLPVLVLVGAGARVGSRRREERLAALRLAGATPGEVRRLAAVEAALGATLGAALGLAVAWGARELAVTRGDFFRSDLTPPVLWVVLVVGAAPVLAATSAAIALRRVTISPLGVVRRVPRSRATARRAWLLGGTWVAFGLGVVLQLALVTPPVWLRFATDVALVAIPVGLIVAGPWCVSVIASRLARAARGPRALLAARRLAADPRAASRPVTIATLSLFLALLLAVFLPSRNAHDDAREASRISPDLRASAAVSYGAAGDGTPGPSIDVARRVAALRGVRVVVPLVAAVTTVSASGSSTGGSTPHTSSSDVALATCDQYARATKTDRDACRPGAPGSNATPAVPVPSAFGLADGTRVRAELPPPTVSVAALELFPAVLVAPEAAPPQVVARGRLDGMLVGTDGSAGVARRVGALLAREAPGMSVGVGAPMPSLSITYSGPSGGALLGYVLLFAMSALVVTTVDGIAERRRSLAALRAGGASPAVLRGAAMLEVAVPVGVAAVFGGLSGFVAGIALALVAGYPVVVPWGDVLAVAGLIAAMWAAVTAVSLPAMTRASSLRNLRTG